MFTSENVQKYARIALYWLAGALVSKGVIQQNATWIEPAIGFVLTLINFGWTIYGNRLNGLLAQVQAKDGVLQTQILVDPSKISPAEVTNSTPVGISAK